MIVGLRVVWAGGKNSLVEKIWPGGNVPVKISNRFQLKNFSKTIQKIVVEKSALQENLNQRFVGRDRRIIESAMEELECGACIKFTRRTSEQSYVHILADQ